MWALIVYPPLVVPWVIGFPASCRRCGTGEVPHLHEWGDRKLDTIDRDYRDGDRRLVTAYKSAHFRCPKCRLIMAPHPPNGVPGFRFQRSVAAQILTAYCLGRHVNAIPRALSHRGIKVSRATVYRFLDASKSNELEELRGANKRRARRAGRETAAVVSYSHFFAEIPDRGDHIGRPWIGGPEEATSADRFLDVYRSAELLHVYADATTLATIQWLDTYLQNLGNAGVRTYDSLKDMNHRFEPFKTRLKEIQDYPSRSTVALSQDQLSGPFDLAQLEIGLAIRGVLRRAIWAEDQRKPGASPLIPERTLYDYF